MDFQEQRLLVWLLLWHLGINSYHMQTGNLGTYQSSNKNNSLSSNIYIYIYIYINLQPCDSSRSVVVCCHSSLIWQTDDQFYTRHRVADKENRVVFTTQGELLKRVFVVPHSSRYHICGIVTTESQWGSLIIRVATNDKKMSCLVELHNCFQCIETMVCSIYRRSFGAPFRVSTEKCPFYWV